MKKVIISSSLFVIFIFCIVGSLLFLEEGRKMQNTSDMVWEDESPPESDKETEMSETVSEGKNEKPAGQSEIIPPEQKTENMKPEDLQELGAPIINREGISESGTKAPSTGDGCEFVEYIIVCVASLALIGISIANLIKRRRKL